MNFNIKKIAFGFLASVVWILYLARLIDGMYYPTLEEPYLNALANMIVAFSLPVLTACFAWNVRCLPIKVCGMALSMFCVVPCALYLLFSWFSLPDIKKAGTDISFKRIAEVKNGSKSFRLYLTNGGATTDFGLVARKEIDLPIGIVLVSNIFDQYHADSGRFIKHDGTVTLSVDTYGKRPGFEVMLGHL